MVVNDPYLIYRLKGKRISVQVPPRFGGSDFAGVVESAYRNPLDKQVELVVDGAKHVFPTPDVITEVDGDVAFVYGQPDEDCLADDDDALLAELRAVAIDGGNIDDAIRRLETDAVVVVWLRLG